jgi:hypothetical protein
LIDNEPHNVFHAFNSNSRVYPTGIWPKIVLGILVEVDGDSGAAFCEADRFPVFPEDTGRVHALFDVIIRLFSEAVLQKPFITIGLLPLDSNSLSVIKLTIQRSRGHVHLDMLEIAFNLILGDFEVCRYFIRIEADHPLGMCLVGTVNMRVFGNSRGAIVDLTRQPVVPFRLMVFAHGRIINEEVP